MLNFGTRGISNQYVKCYFVVSGTLTIVLDDENDKDPTFLPSNQYHVNISEGRDIYDVVTTISAEDRDKNQQITFSVAPADSGTFEIDSNSGK